MAFIENDLPTTNNYLFNEYKNNLRIVWLFDELNLTIDTRIQSRHFKRLRRIYHLTIKPLKNSTS